MLPPDLLKPLTLELRLLSPPSHLQGIPYSGRSGWCQSAFRPLFLAHVPAARARCQQMPLLPCGFRAPCSIRVRPSVTHNSPFPIFHSESVLAVDERDAERRRRGPDAWVRIAFAPASKQQVQTRVQTAEQQCPYRKVPCVARPVCWLSG